MSKRKRKPRKPSKREIRRQRRMDYLLRKQRQLNPRYIAYAAASGLTPDEALARDKREHPGGCMIPFMLWIGDRVRAFFEAHPEAFVGRSPHALSDHDAFDRFLGIGP